MAYQRNLRDWTHNCHVMLLVAHYKLRNYWCSQDIMKVNLSTLTIYSNKKKRY
jgi:xeroderma pigmentosum group C-complementing protein